jgi:hypothetical protein
MKGEHALAQFTAFCGWLDTVLPCDVDERCYALLCEYDDYIYRPYANLREGFTQKETIALSQNGYFDTSYCFFAKVALRKNFLRWLIDFDEMTMLGLYEDRDFANIHFLLQLFFVLFCQVAMLYSKLGMKISESLHF